MHGCTCNKCLDVVRKCQTCSAERNTCKDRKAAKRHLRDHYQLTIENENFMKRNEIEESEEVDLGVDGDFDVEDLEKDVNSLNSISDLKNEMMPSEIS